MASNGVCWRLILADVLRRRCTANSVGSSLEIQRHTTDAQGKKGRGPTLSEQNSLIRVRTVDAAAFLDSLGDGTSRNIVLKCA